jgi:hypothetical protein
LWRVKEHRFLAGPNKAENVQQGPRTFPIPYHQAEIGYPRHFPILGGIKLKTPRVLWYVNELRRPVAKVVRQVSPEQKIVTD